MNLPLREPLPPEDGSDGPDPIPLFRPEALAPRQAAHGRAAPLTPPSWRWLTIGMAMILGAVLLALFLGSFSRKETVTGRLRPAGGELRMIAPRTGVVSEVLVGDGSWVRRGQPLLRVSTETMLDERASTNQRLVTGLAEERRALEARLASSAAAFASQRHENRLVQSSLQAQAATIGEELAILEQRLAMATKFVEAGRTLEQKGFITLGEMKRREEQRLAILQDIVEKKSTRAQLLSQVAQTGAATAKAAAEAQGQENSVRENLASLAQREVEAGLQGGYVLRAPMAGQVTALRAVAGKSVDTTQPLLTILAARRAAGNGGLVADLFVPPSAAGFVEPGQKVRLLIDAFPYQKYGPVQGIVASVSATALAPEELERVEGDPKEPVYVVTVRFDEASLKSFKAAGMMKAGMTLTADIVLEERSLIEWLLEPLLASRHRM